MNRPLIYILMGIIGLSSCKKSEKFVLQGELTEYPHENILVVYDDPVSKIDTIFPKEGRFIYEIIPDTSTLIRLLSPDGEDIPLIAVKGEKVRLSSTFAQPAIDTKGLNKEYADFLGSAEGMKRKDMQTEAASFIKTHPKSYLSAYLINRFFAQTDTPDKGKIEELIKPLDGSIKDCRLLTILQKRLQTDQRKSGNQEFLGYFSYKDRDKKFVSWGLTEGSCTLVNLWASWDKKSTALRDTLERIAQKLPDDKFRIINVSLDYDREAWMKACKEDTKRWAEVCDFKGWNTPIVLQHKIEAIPANILIDRSRKIIAYDLYDDTLYKKVTELTKQPKK